MKKIISLLLATIMSFALLTACGTPPVNDDTPTAPPVTSVDLSGTKIILSDDDVLVDGVRASEDSSQAVYVAHDIIYYEDGHDFTYGEGEESEMHSKEEADQHTVIHITQPGDYVLSGALSAGQIAVDLGKDAKENPNAVVSLYLNGVDIVNTVAPAIIFYNVYEPFHEVEAETATKDVDTSAAGANVFIVDGTENIVTGSHVARIYKPDSVVLSEDGTEVIDEKKLHKYDGAFYSKMTMNINGDEENTGVLNIIADNEGLDSEMHLTINGGVININSGNDGINTNEDGVSVMTMNGGILNIMVTGSTGEGDGIDSNGWLVINGGAVFAQACGFSGDSGIDSDMGIHINGGIVAASGNMLDRIAGNQQNYAVLSFEKALGEGTYSLKNNNNEVVISAELTNDFTNLIVSSPALSEGDYTLWYNDTQLLGLAGEGDMMGGMSPNFGEMPNNSPEDIEPGMTPPEGMLPPDGINGDAPDGFNPDKMKPGNNPKEPNGDKKDKDDFIENEDGTITFPDGTTINADELQNKFQDKENKMPNGQRPEGQPDREHGGLGGVFGDRAIDKSELSDIFTIIKGANYFSFISAKTN